MQAKNMKVILRALVVQCDDVPCNDFSNRDYTDSENQVQVKSSAVLSVACEQVKTLGRSERRVCK